jgi:cytochrome bd-type quinol oxidase subunit 2
MEITTLNYFAIISAAIMSFLLGGAYVSIFGKQLAKLNGSTGTETQAKQKTTPKGLIGIFFANLAMAFGLTWFINTLGTSAISDALWLTLWSFVSFVGPLTIGPVLWEGKSIKWWIFNNLINVVCLFAMILILMFWK